MDKQSRLELLENLSLLGSGMGAVASIVLNQASYAIPPLSLALALSVLNRRADRQSIQEKQASITAIDQRLSQQFHRLQHHVAKLPTPEMIHQLSRGMVLQNRELSEHLYAEIVSVQTELQQKFEQFEQQDLNTICHDLQQLQEQYNTLSENIKQIQSEWLKVSDSTRIDQVEAIVNHFNLEIGDLQTRVDTLSNQTKPNLTALQERVNRLDRLFGKLPPPVDASSLKKEVAELIRIIGDLAPKRDVLALTHEVQSLQQQQEQFHYSIAAIESAANGVQQLQDRMNALMQEQQQLDERLGQASAVPDLTALQHQVNDLAQQISATADAVSQLDDQSLDRHPSPVPNGSNWVVDFHLARDSDSGFGVHPELSGSRTVLLEALETAQQRLILICPWSVQCPLEDELLQAFQGFLSQNRRLDIGWCQTASSADDRLLGKLRRTWYTHSQTSHLQATLRRLLQLKQAYPNSFQFKILGTSENFLVADRSFAVLGMADTLKSTTIFSELHLKLRTQHPKVIQQLIHRFDSSNLALDDLKSYWNRAVTRHDLGDYAGAIADYTHWLTRQIDPSLQAIGYNYRGTAHFDTGNIVEAIADFEQSIQLQPHQAAAYCNWGFIRAEHGDYQGAIKDFSCAIQSQPDCAIAYFQRGLARQRLGHYQESLSDYTAALQQTPDAPTVYYYRSQVWQLLAQYEQAIDDLVEALDGFTAQNSEAKARKAWENLTKLRQWTASQPGILRHQGSNSTRAVGLSRAV